LSLSIDTRHDTLTATVNQNVVLFVKQKVHHRLLA